MEQVINNGLYDQLGQDWYTATDHPVALLRQESRLKTQWILKQLTLQAVDSSEAQILDIGCGAGFLCNELAQNGYHVSGLDMAADALAVARRFDSGQTVKYIEGDATKLPLGDAKFDVVTSLDFLEHVENPGQVIAEAARVLKPGGLFFFHTFNRNWLSYLVAIKGVEWFVANTPKNLHLYKLFITPAELASDCEKAGLTPREWTGLRPRLNRSFFKMLSSGTVDDKFEFCETSATWISYLGFAEKADS